MAFIRDYAGEHSGDPFRRVIRAGKLVRKVPTFTRGTSSLRMRARGGARTRYVELAGDPFRFKLPKFVRKLSLKKVVSGVGKLAKAALPLAAGFIPGVGGLVAGLVGAHAPEQDAAIAMPEPTGTVGEVSRELDTQDEEAEEFYGGPDDEDEDEDGEDFLDYEDDTEA